MKKIYIYIRDITERRRITSKSHEGHSFLTKIIFQNLYSEWQTDEKDFPTSITDKILHLHMLHTTQYILKISQNCSCESYKYQLIVRG